MITDLYTTYSTALVAHINTSLDQASNAAEDIAQDVWLWAMEQHQPPSWPALQRAADWLVRAELARCADAPDLVGLRPHPTAHPTVPTSTTSEAAPERQHLLIGGTRSGKTSLESFRLAAAAA